MRLRTNRTGTLSLATRRTGTLALRTKRTALLCLRTHRTAPIALDQQVSVGGFESGDPWVGGTPDAAIFYEGAQSIRLRSTSTHTTVWTPGAPVDLTAREWTIRLRSPLGFTRGGFLWLLVTDASTFWIGTIPQLADDSNFLLYTLGLDAAAATVDLSAVTSVAMRIFGGFFLVECWLDDWRLVTKGHGPLRTERTGTLSLQTERT
jgi:hypothetical protein